MRFGQLFTMALAAASAAVPVSGSSSESNYPREQDGGGDRCKADTSILELVFCASGESGFDTRKQDYDILRDLVIAAELVEAVAGLSEVTVFIPNDSAFERLAEALGYEGDYDEDAIFTYLADALGGLGDLKDVITTVILYHVADEEYSFDDLVEEEMTVTTLQGGTVDSIPTTHLDIDRVILKDMEPDLPDPRVHDRYRDLNTNQGPVHIITRVLLPLDL